MQKGETRRLWFPKALVVHEGEGPAGEFICFEIQLLDVYSLGPPADLKPPAAAEKTASGLATQVLKKGGGTIHPTKDSIVRVSYTGWTADGKVIDSSIAAGRPAEISLHDVVTGWAEGLELMVEGEQRRLWIPEELANKGRPGPQGTLVFDVELLQVVK
jgi:peptidylprolyl isomerase